MFVIDVNLIICIAAAWLIELVLGAQRALPGPFRLAGRFMEISADRVLAVTERMSAHGGGKRCAPRLEKSAGVFLSIYIVLFTFIITAVLLDLSRRLHISLYYILNILIMCAVLDTRKAADAAGKKMRADVVRSGIDTVAGDKSGARACDTNGDMGADGGSGLVQQAVAGLSKNCLDGILTPAICIFCGVFIGLPATLAISVKMISVLNQVIGNDGGRYRSLGWAAEKLDAAVNFIPARLSGILLPLLAPVSGAGLDGMLRGFRATRHSHAARSYSDDFTGKNEIWPAAAFAGILGIKLGGAGGDAYEAASTESDKKKNMVTRAPEPADLRRAIRLMATLSIAVAAMCCGALAYFAISAQ